MISRGIDSLHVVVINLGLDSAYVSFFFSVGHFEDRLPK
jgi:hypothetical protein